MQIGNPTDVKHVAHIGMDGPSANKPSWVWYDFHLFYFSIVIAGITNVIAVNYYENRLLFIPDN